MPSRFTNEVDINYFEFPLTAAAVALQGNMAFGSPTTGKLVVAVASGVVPVGFFTRDETGDGTGTGLVQVEFFSPIRAYWFKNSATNPVLFAFTLCGLVDGATVRVSAALTPILGTVLALDTTRGVLVTTDLVRIAESATIVEDPPAARRRE
jgi:hypothetical protein